MSAIKCFAHSLANQKSTCDEFYYFGVCNGVDLPSNLRENLSPQAGYGVITNGDKSVQLLIDFVRSHKDKYAKFKDNGGKVGGKGIAQNGSASGSYGGANQSSKTSKCQENKRLHSDDKCSPKNGKYEIELDTNFGTYYY